jgi:hypothetical protein
MVVYLNGIDEMGPKPVAIGPAVNARTVIGVADNDQRVWTGALYDVQIYSRPIAAGEVAKIMEGNVAISSAPQPEDGATDVPRDVTLSWTAGEFAATHDVYFGTAFDDVNEAGRADTRGVLLSQSHVQTSFDFEGVLALGQTYYWRVDEVNAAPDYTIFKGEVWSFTTEPVGYTIAKSARPAKEPPTRCPRRIARWTARESTPPTKPRPERRDVAGLTADRGTPTSSTIRSSLQLHERQSGTTTGSSNRPRLRAQNVMIVFRERDRLDGAGQSSSAGHCDH